MNFKDILAISGQSGLYKFVAQSRNGIIVESLANGTRSCASASARVSALSEIAIFTEGEDMPLAKVFQNIYECTTYYGIFVGLSLSERYHIWKENYKTGYRECIRKIL